MQTIAFMTFTLLKRLTLSVLVCAACNTASAATTGPETSTLHIGLRLLSGCKLQTTPPRASCSAGAPIAIALRSSNSQAPFVARTGQDASALAGPVPAGGARITTIAF